MIEIDGSYGAGGGQILRTALGLAALECKPFKLYNIRQKRKNPGIQEQHLQAINAVAQLCNAETKGATKGSSVLEFYPNEISKKEIDVKISTAGSIGLVLQALLIPAIKHDLNVNIKGGATFGKGAPPVYYTSNVLAYWLKKIGVKIEVSVDREGFYPVGGAEVKVKTCLGKLEKLIAIEKTPVKEIGGISVASAYLKKRNVAERQAKAAELILQEKFNFIPNFVPKIEIKYSESSCPGTGLQLWLITQNSVIGASDFGELRKSAEQIGEKSTTDLIWEYENGIVDSWAADQLLPYLAFRGGEIKVSKITEHTKTNIWVIQKFLPTEFEIKDCVIKVKEYQ